MKLAIDDGTAWDFLFEVNEASFGWVDIDCFVLNSSLFAEIACLDASASLNGVWSYESGAGFPIACPHFAFVNVEAIRAVRASPAPVGAGSYSWSSSRMPLLHPRSYSRTLTRRQSRLMSHVLGVNERGRPRVPGDNLFFDVLVAFQVAAHSLGYQTRLVRRLAHATGAGTAGEPVERTPQQVISDELVHVGGISYLDRSFRAPAEVVLFRAAEYSMLAQGGIFLLSTTSAVRRPRHSSAASGWRRTRRSSSFATTSWSTVISARRRRPRAR